MFPNGLDYWHAESITINAKKTLNERDTTLLAKNQRRVQCILWAAYTATTTRFAVISLHHAIAMQHGFEFFNFRIIANATLHGFTPCGLTMCEPHVEQITISSPMLFKPVSVNRKNLA
jgi:hypothetical protein